MQIPRAETGLTNYYEAHLSDRVGDLYGLTVNLDAFDFPHPVKLMKIDAEGHDPAVLGGAEALLMRDHPILIVETSSEDVAQHLRGLGYKSEKLPSSPNTLFR